MKIEKLTKIYESKLRVVAVHGIDLELKQGEIFGLVAPITIFGCVHHPWAWLGIVRWLQIGVLFNPIVYMSEGLRAALKPGITHMPWWAMMTAPSVFTKALGRLGLRGFLGRVLS